MGEPLFKSTLLAQTQDPVENQKASLDLLKKVNDVHALSAAGQNGLQASIDALTAALAASLPVSGANSFGDWVELSNGVLIQYGWGYIGGVGGPSQSTTFTLPLEFDGNYSIVANGVGYKAPGPVPTSPTDITSTAAQIVSSVVPTSSTSYTIVWYSGLGGTTVINNTFYFIHTWMAIGKKK